MDKIHLLNSLEEKGFSKEILYAFSKVSREDFIPEELEESAYEDIALPIGNEQTISQPYTIAEMLSLLDLKKGQAVLEVGSGCGYVLALLSVVVGEEGRVYGIEIIKELAEKSKTNLKNYGNVEVYQRNGSKGLKEKAPFDRILISAALNEIPEKLIEQLKNNGIIIAPINSGYREQSLTCFQRSEDKLIIKKEIPGFVFVPFVAD